MDVERKRLYHREWKRNKPYLPKSTSLPLLRLLPENRAVFVCEQCGFSNLLVPMCLWCCWSSIEARREFETSSSARKTLRRAARSAPHLFGKPALTANSRNKRVVAGKHQSPGQALTSKSPHAARPTASAYALCPSSTRRNGGREDVIKDPIEVRPGPYSRSGTDDCGIGSSENNYNGGPTTVTAQHPRPRADLIPSDHTKRGHKLEVKGGTDNSTLSSATSAPLQLAEEPGNSLVCLATCTNLASTESAPDFHTPRANTVHGNTNTRKSPSVASNSIRAMEIDASTTDTRCDPTDALCVELSPPSTTIHSTATARQNRATGHIYRDICKFQGTAPMDIDVATATQSSQSPISSLNRPDVFDSTERPRNINTDATINTTLTKIGKKRAPIPSMLLHQDSSPIDTPTSSNAPASPIPLTTQTTSGKTVTKHIIPTDTSSPVRTLRRRKRLSLSDTTNFTGSSLATPDPPVPLTTPSVHRPSAFEFTPTLPSIASQPDSLNQNQKLPSIMKQSPTIVISAPVPPSTLIDTPRTIPNPVPMPSPALPRIGTPKRPYYTTVRASMNGRPSSSIPQLSTPPTSPTSPTFSSASAGRSRSPASNGTLGSPDSSVCMNPTVADVAQRPTSMLVDRTAACGDGAAMTPRPVSTSAIVTVPPLPPVVNHPVPIPIPVQRHMRPSSPVRSILSVLDPALDDDEDEELEYNQFGIPPSRFGSTLREKRGGNPKDKHKARGETSGYHFPLSLSLSLGRKRGRALAAFGLGPDKGKEAIPPLPTLSTSRSYASIGPSRGCSMSGEMELRMALAERNINANNGDKNDLKPAFRFRENMKSDYDGEVRTNRGKNGGRKLMKMRSTIGLSSRSSPSSPPSSPSRPRIGSKLKEMSAHFLGKFQGGDANHR